MDQHLIDRFAAIVGPKGWTTDADIIGPHLKEWRGLYRGRTPLMVSPNSTEEVAQILTLCTQTRTGIVPQGGNTGLVGGQIPHGEILLSLLRLNRIRAVDPDNNTITAEAGCVLASVQAAADRADRLFPLSLAAEGSATIGGNLSTNAGGTAVLRYGSARALTLGLEIVLPNGQVLNLLRGLRKDNTGYDLKQLFIGAEGTLGVITAAVLSLYPKPRAAETAFAAMDSPADALALLHRLRAQLGETVSTFELVPRFGVDLVLQHLGGADPFAVLHPWYALIEIASGDDPHILRSRLEQGLAGALDQSLIKDVVLAGSDAQRRALRQLREGLSEAQKREGASIKCDIAVPVSQAALFIERADAAVKAVCAGLRPIAFGHLGDGNIHFNLMQPKNADPNAFLDSWDELSAIVHDQAARLGGSISAEHGLGVLKRDTVVRYKDAVEIALMRTIKASLDPLGIMNPGKLLRIQSR